MIQLLADILVWACRKHSDRAFAGHLGGDDFVLVLNPDKAERLCVSVVRCFKRLVKNLYRAEDIEAGYVTGLGRNGRPGEFPLVSVSLGILECKGLVDLGEIGRRAAEVKKYAKSLPGNVFIRDRRGPVTGDNATCGLTGEYIPESDLYDHI